MYVCDQIIKQLQLTSLQFKEFNYCFCCLFEMQGWGNEKFKAKTKNAYTGTRVIGYKKRKLERDGEYN